MSNDDGSVTIVVRRDAARAARLAHLSTPNWRHMTSDDVDAIDHAIDSDGCSGPALQFYRNGCVLHDFWYRTHVDFDGRSITRRTADANLREYIARHSVLDGMSPMAHWRYVALRLFGGRAWGDDARGSPIGETPTRYGWRCSS